MYFCALPAILGAEIDVVSVRIGDAVNDQYHRGSEAGSPVSEGYVTHNGRQRADFWVNRTLRNLSGCGPWHNQWEQAMKQQVALTRQALKTPRAAAVAGIIFAVLITTSLVLIRLAIPEELGGTNTAAWLQGNSTTISLALTLVPFAGIAFLWFIGVVRDRMGA